MAADELCRCRRDAVRNAGGGFWNDDSFQRWRHLEGNVAAVVAMRRPGLNQVG